MWLFKDREDAGRQLAAALTAYAHRSDVLVLGLPRGGVPVAGEVGRVLGVPVDVFLVRKLGVPGHAELAMGAIAEGGVRVLTHELIAQLGIPAAAVEQVSARERLELERRERLYRADRQPPAIGDRTVIVVDDGLATGATMEAAVLALKSLQAAAIIVAAPVGAPEACRRLARSADRVVSVAMPEPFSAVGQWYRDFSQTTDEEVHQVLASVGRLPRRDAPAGGSPRINPE